MIYKIFTCTQHTCSIKANLRHWPEFRPHLSCTVCQLIASSGSHRLKITLDLLLQHGGTMASENIYRVIKIDEQSITAKYIQLTNAVLQGIDQGKLEKDY